MGQYMLRRLLQMIPVLVILSMLIFALLQMMPGDAALNYLGADARTDPKLLEATRHELGLDQPVPVQSLNWLGRTLHGDFGKSINNARRPVIQLIGQALPKSIQLALMTVTFALLLSVPLGVLSAINRGS